MLDFATFTGSRVKECTFVCEINKKIIGAFRSSGQKMLEKNHQDKLSNSIHLKVAY